MGVPSSTREFLDLLRASALLDAAQLARHFPDLDTLLADPRDAAAALVSAGLLTPYQSKYLLLGKHKGFFVAGYKVLQPIGKGGTGKVFLAEHTTMKRRVALKVIGVGDVKDRATLERLHREAQAAAALDHPNIV